MNTFRRFYNMAPSYYRCVKTLNPVQSAIYFKPYPFRNSFLWNEKSFTLSSKRFFCSDTKNKQLLDVEEEDEIENFVKSGEENDYDMDDIDELSRLFDEKMMKISQPPSFVIDPKHLDYLSEISNGNEESLKTLKVCYLAISQATETLKIPFNFESYDWILMQELNKFALKRYLRHVLMKTMNRNREKLKSMPSEIMTAEMKMEEFDPGCYHLYHNSIYLRIHGTAIKHRIRSKGMLSLLYSPVVVYDCSYEKYMGKSEICSLAKQLSLLIAQNSKSRMPLHIVLCNFNETLYLYKIIDRYMQSFHTGNVLITKTEKSYLDIYPARDLIYLSPHGKEIQEWDQNKIYIVGAFVDKSSKKPISLMKSKMENLECMKFPIDRYVKWEKGHKCLSLPLVQEIINEMFISNDWNEAFKLMPRRCLTKYTESHRSRKAYRSHNHMGIVAKSLMSYISETKTFKE